MTNQRTYEFVADAVDIARRKSDRAIKITFETGENFNDVAAELFQLPTNKLLEITVKVME